MRSHFFEPTPPPTAQTDRWRHFILGIHTLLGHIFGVIEAIFDICTQTQDLGASRGTPGGPKKTKNFFLIFHFFFIEWVEFSCLMHIISINYAIIPVLDEFYRFACSPQAQFFSSNLCQIKKNVHLAWWKVFSASNHPKLTDPIRKNRKIEKKIFIIFDPPRGNPNLSPNLRFGGRYQKSPRWPQKYALGEYACQKWDTYDNQFRLWGGGRFEKVAAHFLKWHNLYTITHRTVPEAIFRCIVLYRH